MTNILNPLQQLALEVTREGPDSVAFDGLRVLQHPDRFHKFLTGRELDIVPVTVQLWPSLSCDVMCPTCPYRLTDARTLADADHQNLHLMPSDLFRTLADSMVEAGVQSVFLTGGGEPILHPEIVNFVRHAKHIGLSWGMFTNGISLDETLARQLFEQDPGFFRVSLEAGNDELYNKIYATDTGNFEHVKKNVVVAGKVALDLNVHWFGVGFTLMPNSTLQDLKDIRETLIELFEASDMGVNLASFRPRVIHHVRDKVVAPQKFSGQYHKLANMIREVIEMPLLERYKDEIRIDHKFGAFSDCDIGTSPTGGWGGAWIATLDHKANGSIVSHLTGSSYNPSAWGFSLAEGSFKKTWGAERRRRVHDDVVKGRTRLPVANGFRTVDGFLNRVKEVFPDPLNDAEAWQLLEGVENWPFHRSQRPEFVG
ncbi:radical SAM protein [Rhodovulum sulfidophilum]|uniref:radical SAM protein n=1 Tax=Rhodovulum sulfidophilum TaxID=35806 RepID=UPI00138A1E3F|nr:radical SAM protein [Rhodovulum sulfidophilum]NDK36905.1 radical SAM protein [Rhodovulum sulfidophilum]